MMSLKKVWVRVIVSLLAGAVILELVYVTTGIPLKDSFVLLYGLIVYFILTGIVKSRKDS